MQKTFCQTGDLKQLLRTICLVPFQRPTIKLGQSPSAGQSSDGRGRPSVFSDSHRQTAVGSASAVGAAVDADQDQEFLLWRILRIFFGCVGLDSQHCRGDSVAPADRLAVMSEQFPPLAPPAAGPPMAPPPPPPPPPYVHFLNDYDESASQNNNSNNSSSSASVSQQQQQLQQQHQQQLQALQQQQHQQLLLLQQQQQQQQRQRPTFQLTELFPPHPNSVQSSPSILASAARQSHVGSPIICSPPPAYQDIMELGDQRRTAVSCSSPPPPYELCFEQYH